MLYDCPQCEVEKSITVDSITSIHYLELDDQFTDAPDTHDAWELVYVDRGECYAVAGDDCFLLRQGEMYFHKPNERHMLKTIRDVTPNVFVLLFSTSSPSMRYFEDKKIAASVTAKQHIAAIMHEAPNTFELPFNSTEVNELREKTADPLWGGQQSILLHLELMLIELIRENQFYIGAPKRFFPKEILDDPFVLSIIDYMEARLYGKLTMNELSANFSFGKTYISRCFKRVCGYSVLDYFTLMKVNEAKQLIRSGKYNFFEISEMLMFSNSHYFSTVFKKHTGMTPTEYKRACKSD